jgi:hypothetical protein
MKRLALAITLITSAALLAGCIIVPPRHGGYYRDGYRSYHGDGRYQGGPDYGYGQPGPRR